MALYGFDHRLAPGLGAAVAGAAASLIWDSAAHLIMSASVGAITAALVFMRSPIDRRAEPSPPAPPAAPPAPESGGLAPGQGRALLERLPMGVVLVDARSNIAFTNDQANAMFGLSDLAGRPSSILRAPRLIEAIDGGVEDGLSCTVQFTLSRAQDVHLRAHIRPLTPIRPSERGNEPILMVLIEDVTQLFRTVALHRDFVANASHELKTPLSSITGIIQTLQGHARDDPDAWDRFLSMMASQADRMKRLVEDLLSLNRIELNERIIPRDPQAVRRIVWEVADALAPFAEENGMTLEVAPASDLPLVLGSREELAQVFRNLIDNAIKYGRPGTPVKVEIVPESPDRIDMIGIAVIDSGHGIAREHIPRLTERFYRVSVSRSREKGGTGLGLAIVKHILNRHRGDLEITSVQNEGSTFTVWLPIAERETSSALDRADAA